MSVVENLSAYYMLSLLAVSILVGIINLWQFFEFYHSRKIRFIQIRKPALICIYCAVACARSLFSAPYLYFTLASTDSTSIAWLQNGISAVHRERIADTQFAATCINTILRETLLILVAIRSWCLYYDFRCIIAQTERLWRLHINDEEQNFWLSHRARCGNYKFLLPVSVVVLLMLIAFICGVFFAHPGVFMVAFVTVTGIPTCIFILFLYSRFQGTNDQYMAKQELWRLCVCVLLLGVAFVVWVVSQILQSHMDAYVRMFLCTVDVVFVYLTVHFQTQWVLKQYVWYRQRVLNMQHPNAVVASNSKSKHKNDLQMVDVLRSKDGFKALVSHCVSEMNVEGILFLVEVSQYKEKLKQSRDCGEKKITAHNLNVFTTNIHSLLLEARFMHGEEQQLQFARNVSPVSGSRQSYMRRRESAMVWGFNSSRAQQGVETQTPVITDSSGLGQAAPPIQIKANDSPSLEPRCSLRLTTSQEDTFKMFQEDILGRNWLPINNKMKPVSSPTPSAATPGPEEIEEIQLDAVSEEVVTPLSSNQSPLPSPLSSNATSCDFMQANSSANSNESRTSAGAGIVRKSPIPISTQRHAAAPAALILARMSPTKKPSPSASPMTPTKKPSPSASPMTPAETEEKSSHIALSPIKIFKSTLSSPPPSPSTTPRGQDDNTADIYDKARYLFNKYIHTESELAVNISHETRQGLMRLFSLQDVGDASNFMYHSFFAELSDEEQRSIADDARHRITFLKTYLYHCFDIAFHDIWSLVKNDVFLRFQSTPQYQALRRTSIAVNNNKPNRSPTLKTFTPVPMRASKSFPFASFPAAPDTPNNASVKTPKTPKTPKTGSDSDEENVTGLVILQETRSAKAPQTED